MNKKAFLLFLLLTPLIVIVSSTLAFRFGFGPEATKNNGIFFNEFTDITGMEISCYIRKIIEKYAIIFQ